MGGKDVIYVKQQHYSNFQPAEVQKRLKDMADKRFLDVNGQYALNSEEASGKDKVLILLLLYHIYCLLIYTLKILLCGWSLMVERILGINMVFNPLMNSSWFHVLLAKACS